MKKKINRLPKKYYDVLLRFIRTCKSINEIISRSYVRYFLDKNFDLGPSLINTYSDEALATLQEDGYIVRIKRGVYRIIKNK